MVVIFLQNAGSSAIGPFEVGDERDIPETMAKTWMDRGICKKKTSKVKKEKTDGRE
jgi:hypothetical protein